MLVRLDTDEGIYGVGEGTANIRRPARSARRSACSSPPAAPISSSRSSSTKFNTGWTRTIVDQHLDTGADGYLTVSDRPGIGIDLDWEQLGDHPARRGNRIRLFEPGWELRRSADDE